MVARVEKVVYMDGAGVADGVVEEDVDAVGGADDDVEDCHEIDFDKRAQGQPSFKTRIGLGVLSAVPKVKAEELGFTGDLTSMINPTTLEHLQHSAVQSTLEDGTWVLVVLVNRMPDGLILAQAVFGRGDRYSAPPMVLSGDGRKHRGCFAKEELDLVGAALLGRLLSYKPVERRCEGGLSYWFQRVRLPQRHCRCQIL